MKQIAIKFRVFSFLYLTIQLFNCCAFTNQINGADFSAYDLINEVNKIRASNGLSVLQINTTLMNVAQSHSEYQASISQSSHAGPSGEIVTVRVAASGYGGGAKIVAGENVAGFSAGMTDMLPVVVYEIWADPVHRGAMINPKYQDIGVGIAMDGRTVYVTLNLAGVVSDNKGTAATSVTNLTTSTGLNSNAPSNPAILPLFTTTPLSDGTVYHVVGYGQTLSTIARIYQVDIQELINLNQIEPDRIYAGQKLLVIPGGKVAPTVTPTAIKPSDIPVTQTFTASPIVLVLDTSTPTLAPIPVNTKETGLFLIFAILGIILIASLMYFIRPPSKLE
jgi:LysM repeat protein